jgi:predicted O-methyltransferase YrrM
MSNISKTLSAAYVAARNVLLGGSVASLSMLHRPRSILEHATESLFLYKSIADKRGLPQKFVFEVLNCSPVSDLKIANFQSEEAWMRPTGSYSTDLISLCLLCQCLRPKTIFEIGTLRGYTAWHMAMNTEAECQIFTLDLPIGNDRTKFVSKLPTTLMDDIHCQMDVKEYYFSGVANARKIQTLFGDSATFDFSPYLGKVDFFFIDGAHSYEYVRSDSENALKCVRPGGVIAWHDFGRAGLNGVSRCLLELSRKMQIYSVPGGSLAFAIIPENGKASS